MKHRTNILISFVMSIMIVWMGSGVLLFHCCHSETSKRATLSDICDTGCTPKTDCMQAKVVTLSPVTNVVSHDFSFQAPVFSLAPFQFPELQEVTSAVPANVDRTPQRWLNLPRAYLSFIRILII